MDILDKVKKLIDYYKKGLLGGEFMPEDNKPNFSKDSEQCFVYFTLPMALNYQRNSYKLWEGALNTFLDKQTNFVFCMKDVLLYDEDVLRNALIKYKVALQPNKQPKIWKTLCNTFVNDFGGSIKVFFENFDNDVVLIKNYIQTHKKDFPYLSGTKILNYWLYVMSIYTDVKLKNRNEISIAPDTHVLQASVKLGVITENELSKSNIREIVSQRWRDILKDSGIYPIDIHTPFWLWSRNGFQIKL